MTSHHAKLTNAQITVIARRCGGKFSHNDWHFATPKQRARFNHLVATRTHTSLLSSILYFFEDLLGWTSILFVAAFMACAFALWCWGAYQALLWGHLIPIMGTTTLAAFHLTAALTWYGFNIFALIQKLSNRAILILIILIFLMLFFGYYYKNHDAQSEQQNFDSINE